MKTFTKRLIPALVVLLFSGLGLATSNNLQTDTNINPIFLASLGFFLGMILYIIALYKDHKKKSLENQRRKMR